MTQPLLIIHTGGTIGMRRSPRGYLPEPGFVDQLRRALAPARMPDLPPFEIVAMPRLLDSANMGPADWYAIARAVVSRYADHAGFVVLHGTDTMAYTASALSFALRGLRKPVIVTGSQIPLREMRNDATNNLTAALLLAARGRVKEVGLFFDGILLRGNRATKVRAGALDAFESPNHPPLAQVGIGIEINRPALWPVQEPECFRVPDTDTTLVAVLKLFPGISVPILERFLADPVRGLILECYGLGNGPIETPGFLSALQQATASGLIVTAISQCRESRVDLRQYAAGSALADAGVSSGFDMTTEAAFAKLQHLLALGTDGAEVARLMQCNWCGECTLPEEADRA